jgi:hypothetical protein
MISSIRWLQESEDIRQKLMVKFDVKKSGGRAVENNKLVSDGVSGEELYTKFNVKALQSFTGMYEITDVYELFAVAVAIIKVENEPILHEEPLRETDAHSARPASNDDAPRTGASKKRGRPKKEKS